jgi:hypothetical protein
MYANAVGWINISGLNARLFPAPFPLFNQLQRAPAGVRTETLQGTSPLPHEGLVASWPVARMIEKKVQ